MDLERIDQLEAWIKRMAVSVCAGDGVRIDS